jgi:hypothetical protein
MMIEYLLKFLSFVTKIKLCLKLKKYLLNFYDLCSPLKKELRDFVSEFSEIVKLENQNKNSRRKHVNKTKLIKEALL